MNLSGVYEKCKLGENYVPPDGHDDLWGVDIRQRTESYVKSLAPNPDHLPIKDGIQSTQQLNVDAKPYQPHVGTMETHSLTQDHLINIKQATPDLSAIGEKSDTNIMCSEFAKVFTKKDIISKTHIYDDNPENFPPWKASFQNALSQLGISLME